MAAATLVIVTTAAPAQGSTGGTIEHWGGYGTNGTVYDKQLSPVALSLPAPVAQVSSSNSTEYALLTNGTVYAWGIGTNGELGNGGTGNSFETPVQVQFPAGVTIAFLPTDVMPYDTAFAVDTTGRVWGWGQNMGGELCLGNRKQYDTPVRLPLPLAHVSTLGGGSNHATYDAGGTVYSCGANTDGELGDGGTQSSTTPVQVTGLGSGTVTSVVASWGDAGVLLSNGTYYDWGYNDAGQLGDGTTAQSDSPVQVTLPGQVAQVAQGGSEAGNGQTLVMLSNGSLYAWGNDASYQLGDGKTGLQTSPERIYAPDGVTYQTLASGGGTSYAISTAGDVYAWGANGSGQVGDGTTAVAKEPVMVESGAATISATSSDVVVGEG
jgi:hypothetical protein